MQKNTAGTASRPDPAPLSGTRGQVPCPTRKIKEPARSYKSRKPPAASTNKKRGEGPLNGLKKDYQVRAHGNPF